MKNIICSGAIFYTLDTNRFLFLHRAQSKQNNVWGLVGGTNNETELPWEGLKREITEEIGKLPLIQKTIPLETFVSDDRHFFYHTYLCIIEKEFIPTLNEEHNGYAWVDYKKWPKPLHRGLLSTLTSKTNQQKFETIFEITKNAA
jgi:ADP-ribose pyrophosphatase YjhB (NUDIX family)